MFKFGNNNYDQLTEEELREIREKRVKRVKTWNAIREILIYILFLWCLFVVAYTNVGISSYKYQTNMREIFTPKVALTYVLYVSYVHKYSQAFCFKINDVNQFWNWAKNKLAVNLRAGPWYNGDQPYGLAGFMSDYSSRLVGFAVMRQVRVENGNCCAFLLLWILM
jgi:hypothetical protein